MKVCRDKTDNNLKIHFDLHIKVDLTLSVPEELTNSISEIPIISKTLIINN